MVDPRFRTGMVGVFFLLATAGCDPMSSSEDGVGPQTMNSIAGSNRLVPLALKASIFSIISRRLSNRASLFRSWFWSDSLSAKRRSRRRSSAFEQLSNSLSTR